MISLGRLVRSKLQTAWGREEPWGGRRHDRRWDDRAALLHVMNIREVVAVFGNCLREQERQQEQGGR